MKNKIQFLIAFALFLSFNNVKAQNFTISSGTQLVTNGAAIITYSGGTMTNNGTITATDASLVFKGAVTYDGSGTATTKNFEIDHSGSSTLNNRMQVTGVLTISNGVLVANDNLTLVSNALSSAVVAPIPAGSDITGIATVERYIPARRAYRFLSPAVTTTTTIYENWQENGSSAANFGTHITGTGGITNGFDATATNNPSMFSFNNTTGVWEAVTNTNTDVFTAGTPCRLMVRGDRTIDMSTNTPTPTATTLRAKGALKTGDYSPTLNPAAEGYSFIGNPYQAPIDFKAVLNAAINIDASVLYYWDPTLNERGGYVTRNLTANTNDVTSSFNEYLQQGQAVFVKNNSTGSPSLTISESHKSLANASAGVFRSASSNSFGMLRVHLQAAENNQWKTIEGTLALFNDTYNWGASSEDANKFSNLDEEVSFVQDNTSLAIAIQPNPANTDELPLKLKNTRYSNYQWQFELSDYDGLTPYLFDTQDNSYTQIDNNMTHAFTVNGQEQTRFKIVFQNTALSTPDFNNQIAVYPNPGNATSGFYLQGITTTAVSLYNVMGQNIPVQTSNNGTITEVKPLVSLSKGVYFVNLTEQGKTTQVKWIVE
ncbi:T9SS type A sorting domain-containing protein [uncultured Flavobacterium sp.]|uniref:T9SS type A sorting domain-containing protein n=1 Tax=uncultured Flavobacterium sp. TaxID=165435 RepID=UPI0030CA4172